MTDSFTSAALAESRQTRTWTLSSREGEGLKSVLSGVSGVTGLNWKQKIIAKIVSYKSRYEIMIIL